MESQYSEATIPEKLFEEIYRCRETQGDPAVSVPNCLSFSASIQICERLNLHMVIIFRLSVCQKRLRHNEAEASGPYFILP